LNEEVWRSIEETAAAEAATTSCPPVCAGFRVIIAILPTTRRTALYRLRGALRRYPAAHLLRCGLLCAKMNRFARTVDHPSLDRAPVPAIPADKIIRARRPQVLAS